MHFLTNNSMKLYNRACSFGLALAVATSGVGFLFSAPANAQKLVNPGPKDDTWRPIKTMVFNYLVQDFKKNGIPAGRDTKIEISPLMMSGDWLTASWLAVSRKNPDGWAGQLLFKKEGERWVYVGGGNYIQDVNTLMEFGVPRGEAESLAAGPDV